MSFILDALKKSEIERQRQTEPGLVDARFTRGRSRLPIWAVLLGVLLAVNLLVLAVVLMRNSAPELQPAAAKSPLAAPADVPAANPAPHFSPLDSAPVYAPEIPVTSADTPPHEAAAPGAAAASPRTATPHVVHRADPVLSEEKPETENDEQLPSISELNLSGQNALPEMHLDVHVYATKPADRFVFINMRKYREGAVLQEGPTLERIRRDGVVLNFHGVRFVLPRQS